MNARILELVKNPEIIQNHDLDLLNSEIGKHPYLQNMRALYLIGIHLFDPENYQKELSVTAAYTTDKKILYQLINKKAESAAVEIQTETLASEFISEKVELVKSSLDEVAFVEKPAVKPVFVEGNLNRILFEGEEDFLDRENETIDIESTLESGKIITKMTVKEEIPSRNTTAELEKFEVVETVDKENFTPENIINESTILDEENCIEGSSEKSFHELEELSPDKKIGSMKKDDFEEAENAETFSPETIIKESTIFQEEPLLEDLSKISFHGLAEFLPEVKIKSTISTHIYEAPKPKISKQEGEMQLLIAQVEAKVKASKKEKMVQSETVENHDINFSENQTLKVSPIIIEVIIPKKKELPLKNQAEIKSPQSPREIEQKTSEKIPEIEKAVWKPMHFSGNKPDPLIDKSPEKKLKRTKNSDDNLTAAQEVSEIKITTDQPLVIASFFTPNRTGEAFDQSIKIEKPSPVSQETQGSNVPVFINTWQKWLKIDRKEEIIIEKAVVSKVEIKNTVIEKFIEKEPRISKLKEESDFVVKEKGSNISHLMTETLANLYVDQKLYVKAIRGYEILSVKHPKKTEYYKTKIQEIKDLRKNT